MAPMTKIARQLVRKYKDFTSCCNEANDKFNKGLITEGELLRIMDVLLSLYREGRIA